MPVLALPLWRARGPRFLALLLLMWAVVRVVSHWPSDSNTFPAPLPYSPSSESILFPDTSVSAGKQSIITGQVHVERLAPASAASQTAFVRPPVMAADSGAALPASGYSGGHRHAWRLALLGKLGGMPGGHRQTLALPQLTRSFAPGVAPIVPLPRWPDASAGRWSLAVAGYWRGGGGSTPAVGPASAARLGGSQSAARLSYLVDPQLRLRAYVRATHTPGRRDEADVAVGMAFRPLPALPVDVHLERRTVVTGGGRDTSLLYAAGGVDELRLPHDFRLSAYGQAGLADYGEVAGFADAAVVVQREVAARHGFRLSLGTRAAAAIQPGARRVDVGPRAALVLPDVGHGAELALDWRERVAGNARPGSGLALTVATEF